MSSAETLASPSPKRAGINWGFFWGMVFGASLTVLFFVTLSKPKQDFRLLNSGLQTVDIVNDSAPWWDRKVLTLHPGMIGLWKFRDGDRFRITPRAEKTPKPGTTPPATPLPSRSESWGSALTPNPDGSGTIVIKHASRTAEVRINDAGKVEFEFTDL
jgi:hypothetical protein